MKPQLAVAALGAALMAAAVLWDKTVTASDLRIIGACVVLAGFDLWLRKRQPPVDGDARYLLGYQDGQRDGYNEGRKVRGNVVALPVEKLCRGDAAPRGRHAARCRDNCAADRKKEGGAFDSPEWSRDGAG